MGAGKATRSCVRKLRRYAHLKAEIEKMLESSSSKVKTKKASSSGKCTKTNEKLLKEMEEIEGWIMDRKDTTVRTKEDIDTLVGISKKHGHYNGAIKVRASNPKVNNYIKTKGSEEKLKFK